MEDPWRLVMSGQYEAAIDEYTRLYIETARTPCLYNRAIAYMLSKDYKAALADYQSVLETTEPRFQSSAEYLGSGICYWYLNVPRQAVTVWLQGLAVPYTDAAGGVQVPGILLYAAERLGDQDLRKEALLILTRFWRNHERRVKRMQSRGYKLTHTDFVYQGLFGWPGAIVPFLLGRIDSAELQRRVERSTADSAPLRTRWQCQADFYLALGALRQGDVVEFRAAMTRCVSQHRPLECEYFLALWEVEHSFPEPAFASVADRP